MNRIDRKFRDLRKAGKKAFIAYITAGDPSLAVTRELVPALEASGADIIELGIPFSDPLADGPTIQAASGRALKRGANLKKVFGIVRELRKHTEIPLVFMTYYNPVLRYGLEAFVEDCVFCGVDGVIIPDLPTEESSDIVRLARIAGLDTIFLAAPTSEKGRIRAIAKSSSGFIYYVSLTGVTGARKALPPEIGKKIRQIRSMTDKPVCVGFGVSTARQARSVARAADGVIVGSAIVRLIEKNLGKNGLVSKASKFAKSLARAIHAV